MRMLRASDWRDMRKQQESLVVVSTQAGQNVVNGVRRLRQLPRYRSLSNPTGVQMVYEPPKGHNPLIVRPKSAVQPLNNAIYLNGKPKPLTATFGDCLRHNSAQPESAE